MYFVVNKRDCDPIKQWNWILQKKITFLFLFTLNWLKARGNKIFAFKNRTFVRNEIGGMKISFFSSFLTNERWNCIAILSPEMWR